MMTLYGSIHSRANRCVWMLKELGLEYHFEPVNFQDGSTHHPEFLSMNPNGRVPVLDDDGFVLFESLAINLYLARKYGGTLTATDLQEDALVTQWTLWVENEIEKPLIMAAANQALFPAHERRPDELELALGKLQRPWGVLDRHLQKNTYLLGERFTVADLNVASVMILVPITGIPLTAWPALQHWLTRCLERPCAEDWRCVSFNIPRPSTALETLAMFV